MHLEKSVVFFDHGVRNFVQIWCSAFSRFQAKPVKITVFSAGPKFEYSPHQEGIRKYLKKKNTAEIKENEIYRVTVLFGPIRIR